MASTEDFRPDLLPALLRDLGAEGRRVELPVRGSSMLPMLRDGDRVQIVPVTGAAVRIGDVVVRVESNGPVIHRVVGWWPSRTGWRLLTKGDGSLRLDPPLRAEGVVARVVARVRDSRVERLDGAGMRIRGRALVSLVAGLIVEVWDRAVRWSGCP
jgi:signal peptidase